MKPSYIKESCLFLPTVWQSLAWQEYQELAKNKTFSFSYKNATALVIERKCHWLKFWKPILWEIPRGPIGSEKDFPELLKIIIEKAKEEKISTIRIYPPTGRENFWEIFKETIFPYKCTQAPEIFPEHTLILDLTKEEDEIFSQMKQKGRYNIRLAKKKGITIFEETDITNFWNILEQTTTRDGFISHPKHVYKALLKSFKENAILLSAKDETGEILASKIFIYAEDTAIYYYGASSNNKRNLMAPYLLQWEGIKWAKAKGAEKYDFLGICPEGDKKHHLSSVAEFKHKFGGERIISPKGKDILL